MKALQGLFVALIGFALSSHSSAQTETPKDLLPQVPAGKQWKLIWQDEFDGTKLDETKWNRLGDWKRRDGFWVKEDAYLSGKGTLLLRTKKDGDRFTCGAVNTQGKFEHAFGYYVARCRMPNAVGRRQLSGGAAGSDQSSGGDRQLRRNADGDPKPGGWHVARLGHEQCDLHRR